MELTEIGTNVVTTAIAIATSTTTIVVPSVEVPSISLSSASVNQESVSAPDGGFVAVVVFSVLLGFVFIGAVTTVIMRYVKNKREMTAGYNRGLLFLNKGDEDYEGFARVGLGDIEGDDDAVSMFRLDDMNEDL